MKLLLKLALRRWSTIRLLLLTCFSLLTLTVAEKMEVFSLGVLINKGTDFFLIFSPLKDGRLTSQDEVSKDDINKRWGEIASAKNPEVITKTEAAKYLSKKDGGGLLDQVQAFLDVHFRISDNLFRLLGLLLIVAMFKGVSFFGSKYTSSLVATRISKDLRQEYFEHIQQLSIRFYQKHNVGMIATRVTGDAGNIALAISSSLFNYLQTPFLVLTSLYLCFTLSWEMSLVVFILCPVFLFPIFFFSRRVRKVSRAMQVNQENFTSSILEFLSGIYTIKLFSNEKYSLNRFSKENDILAKLERKNARYSFSARPVLHTISTFMLVSVLMYGMYVINIPLPEMLVFTLLVHQFYEPIKKFNDENLSIQRGIVAAERMEEVLSIEPEIKDHPDAVELKEFNSDISFNKVSFIYDENDAKEEAWILDDLSFNVRKGETVALVGPTGAGKSTLVNLIPRLYEPTHGSITIDGTPINKLKQKSLRSKIAFVPQKSFLISGTVSENIAFGMDATSEQIKQAAIHAHADEFIVSMSNQYDTMVGEGGRTLSGGQQQRISIARALLRNTPILILDEATSSLDTVSEHKIKLALEEMKDMTKIIIAHRLSTIANADRILYLEQGQLMAQGNKEELMKSCPQFKLMWDIMFKQEKKKSQSKDDLLG